MESIFRAPGRVTRSSCRRATPWSWLPKGGRRPSTRSAADRCATGRTIDRGKKREI